MRIVQVGNEFYRSGHENPKRMYAVRVDGLVYKVIASSRRGAELQAEKRYEAEMGCLPARAKRCG